MTLSIRQLKIYNTLSRQLELFEPLQPPHVGLYVCGPTVYGDPHLGHARPAVTFDVLFRFLQYLGYKVRYVRNITDVGHLENDTDEGEDKIAKKARLEQLEPMEVVQYYTNRYHEMMRLLNVLPPSIEPFASGHVPEQIKTTERILKNGYAYVANGSVYFDVMKYNERYPYGKLSGRVVEELMSERELEGQAEKKNKVDFALWKKAAPQHIMRWESPWSEGFPGWHIECSVMSVKYLGIPFDIHGGGLDLLFPHHECEIAQAVAAYGQDHVRYWMHNNLITINGQKMGKSLGNAISLEQFFSGNHPLLQQPYSPMVLRFFLLQTHYRSTLDFSNEALQAAEKGYKRLMAALQQLKMMEYPQSIVTAINTEEEQAVNQLMDQCEEHLLDDLNTAQALARLFDLATKINSFKNAVLPLTAISKETFIRLKQFYPLYIEKILGLQDENKITDNTLQQLMQLIIDIRNEARARKDFATADKIRAQLKSLNIQLKDERNGSTSWSME